MDAEQQIFPLSCKAPSTYGEQSLKAIWSGSLPPNLTQWPAEPVKVPAVSHRRPAVKRKAPEHKGKPLGKDFPKPFSACTELVTVPSLEHQSQHIVPTFRSAAKPAITFTEEQVQEELLQDMRDLEEDGEKVIWPKIPQITRSSSSTDFSVSVEQPMEISPIEASAPLTPSPPAPEFNLQDLLDLDEAGEKVNWPAGFCPASARAHLLALASRP